MSARPRLTYANVVSTLALVIAMSTGGAYAASQITTSQIADGAVTARKLDGAAVRTTKIADAAVTRYKLAAEAVSAPKLAPGAVTSTRLGTNAVTGAKVADGTLGTDDVGESLTGSDIANNSIGLADLHFAARGPTAYGLVLNGVLANDVPSYGLTSEMITLAEDETETPIPGVYCIDGLPFDSVLAAQATPSLRLASASVPHVAIGFPFYCPSGTDVEVVVYTYAGNVWQTYGASFHIAIWGANN